MYYFYHTVVCLVDFKLFQIKKQEPVFNLGCWLRWKLNFIKKKSKNSHTAAVRLKQGSQAEDQNICRIEQLILTLLFFFLTLILPVTNI